ncbi:hypothetical protein ENSA5_17390 [Enhygromyxa salina]|uniref:Uncharacterized protein n=1 Tax=Enhygromyxa salina TaxID=215803 RepID=A0A2S9YE39_9BACT|nr:hypothetical protein ENSA5_17390 [Enhygromyxa salina]
MQAALLAPLAPAQVGTDADRRAAALDLSTTASHAACHNIAYQLAC